jgi:hypothetical protein
MPVDSLKQMTKFNSGSDFLDTAGAAANGQRDGFQGRDEKAVMAVTD